MLANSTPMMLMLSLASTVMTWQHVVGHTYSTAQSMHLAPIILLTSISTCTGVVLFFLCMVFGTVLKVTGVREAALRMCGCAKEIPGAPVPRVEKGDAKDGHAPTQDPAEGVLIENVHSFENELYEYGDNHGDVLHDSSAKKRRRNTSRFDMESSSDEEDGEDDSTGRGGGDIDAINYEMTGDDGAREMGIIAEDGNDSDDADHQGGVAQGPPSHEETAAIEEKREYAEGIRRRIYSGDILTVSMVWTNVYGLGVAGFLLSYLVTMASTLATFVFIVGLSVVAVYEAVQERRMPANRQWKVGKKKGKVRSAVHSLILLIGLVVMVLTGVHVASIHMNAIDDIRAVDVFFAILAPLATPLLLKAVKRPHTTVMGTLEISLPFTAFICTTFLTTALAMGMRPYEAPTELVQNLVAATTFLPFSWGASLMFVLHATFRRRILYVFCSFLTVFVGREFSMYRGVRIVIASLCLCVVMFTLTVLVSSKGGMRWLARGTKSVRRRKTPPKPENAI
jgi:hypothetical protein